MHNKLFGQQSYVGIGGPILHIFSKPCTVQEFDEKKGRWALAQWQSFDTYSTVVTELLTPLGFEHVMSLGTMHFTN